MTPPTPTSLGIRHIALGAQDLKRAASFYADVLGFAPYHVGDADWEMFRMGATTVSLILHKPLPVPPSPQDPKAVHPAHFGINVDSRAAVDEWHTYLSTRKLSWMTAPKLHRDGSYGFYLKDSEANPLEIIFIPQLPQVSDVGTQGVVLMAHGSSDPKGRIPFESLLAAVKLHGPGRVWKLCYLEFCQPTLFDAVESLAAEGRTDIQVVPVFLASGAHVAKDIPRLMKEAKAKFLSVTLTQTRTVGEMTFAQQGLIEGIFSALGL